jgi:carbonic anhydrase
MKQAILALSLAASLVWVQPWAKEPEPQHLQSGVERIQYAVKHVLEDNAKFAASRTPAYFEPFTRQQTPLATVVSCSDSRVHMHAVDQTPDNDVFVIRNIGNQLATAEGSVEYGVRHLHTPLLMFIGHSACGAVTAAVGDYSKGSAAIRRELDTLKVQKGGKAAEEILANVNHQVAAALKKFAPEVEAGSLAVVGTVYDFRNDYRHGQGKLIVININGETDARKIRQSPFLAGIEDPEVYVPSPR